MTAPFPDPIALQATLVDFALAELVRANRASFAPHWSAESWAKLLIWLALNCGCSGDEAGLSAFAGALGSHQSARLRRLFFERELPDLNLLLMADPAEPQVLARPLEPADVEPDDGQVVQALARVGLRELVLDDPRRWQRLDALVVIPWQECR